MTYLGSAPGRVQVEFSPDLARLSGGLQPQLALYATSFEVVEIFSGYERTYTFGLRLLRRSGTRPGRRHESTASSHSRYRRQIYR